MAVHPAFEPKKTKWMPEVGSVIPVHLPQEVVRGEILRYLDDDTIEVHLNVQPPLSKAHGYYFKQKAILHRAKLIPSGEKWEVKEAA